MGFWNKKLRSGLLASLLGARTLLGAPGLTARNKKLLSFLVPRSTDLAPLTSTQSCPFDKKRARHLGWGAALVRVIVEL